MNFFKWLPLLLISPLLAFDDIALETGAAEYKGKVLYLSEGVVIHHPIGKLASEEMILKPIPGVSPIRLGSADLAKRVRFDLSDGGMLNCSSASIDFPSGKGIFQNSPEQEYVIFSQNLKNKQERLPFIVKARSMELDFEPVRVHAAVRKIAIHRDVQIDYNHDFIAVGDEGTFVRKEGPESSQGVNGIVILQADPHKLCSVTNRKGDLIRSQTIIIDTEVRTIDFDNPCGSLTANGGHKVDFAAERALWSDKNDSVLLQRNVRIAQKGLGKLNTDGELKIIQNNKQLSTLESLGKTVLIQGGDETGPLRTLTCYGRLLVDHIASTVTMESPSETSEQVFFEDVRGQIYADKALIHYQEKNVSQIVLEGDVKVLNGQSEKAQYALADILEYNPSTQEMTLKGKNGKRVLFYDEGKDLQISAPGVLLKRDPITHKETIKGIGDVRFSLVKDEFGELRKKFSLKSKAHPSEKEEK